MDEPFLLILSGPPGSGKTTVGRIVASGSGLSACIHSDWFWTSIVSGGVPPWEAIADGQNRVMIRSAVATAARMADGGYSTVLEGNLGPWHFDIVRSELATCPVPTSYIVLRPDIDTCLTRAVRRRAEGLEHRDALTDEGPIRHLWSEFADLGPYERNVLDSTALDPVETADHVRQRMSDGRCPLLLSRPDLPPGEGRGPRLPQRRRPG